MAGPVTHSSFRQFSQEFSGLMAEDRKLPDHQRLLPENIVLLDRVGSTNDLSKTIAKDSLEEIESLLPVLVVAFEQTEGRGRRGNSWVSPPGRGVYATLIRQLQAPEDAAALPLLTATALAESVQSYLSPEAPPCQIKWPNDLLIGGRKIGGQLIEILSPGEQRPPVALIGFGLNYRFNDGELPTEGATSLDLQADSVPSLPEFLASMVGRLREGFKKLIDLRSAVAAFDELHLHQLGDRLLCRVEGGTVEGEFRGLDEAGRLKLAVDGQERLLTAAEVLVS